MGLRKGMGLATMAVAMGMAMLAGVQPGTLPRNPIYGKKPNRPATKAEIERAAVRRENRKKNKAARKSRKNRS